MGCWEQLGAGKEDEAWELGTGAHRAAEGLPLLPTTFSRGSPPCEEGPGVWAFRTGTWEVLVLAKGRGVGTSHRCHHSQGPSSQETQKGAERKTARFGTVTLGKTPYECHGSGSSPAASQLQAGRA